MNDSPPFAPSPQAVRSPYWFRAKRYGWGWGLPTRREGWIVMAAWYVALVVGIVVLIPHGKTAYVVFAVAMIGVIMAVCWAKGEPPRWRWGD